MNRLVSDTGRPATRVREHLAGQIRAGRLQHDERLPTERHLADSMGISRAAVREAFAAMESEGLIRREVGRGTFVTMPEDPVGRFLSPLRLEASPAKLIEARFVIEPQMVELAVVNATPSDVVALHAQCDLLQGARSSAEFETLDRAFHRAIVEATRNPLLTAIYDALNAARETPEWRKLKEHRFVDRPERRPHVIAEHRAIVAGMEERDAAGARAAMLAHLGSVRVNLLGF